MERFCQRILKYYWPKAISYEDITKTDFSIHRGKIDILTGGFPCQPYSSAGKRLGMEDDRHLWPEMLRAIREINPSTSWEKMFMDSLIGMGDWFSTRCKLTWKMKGTKYNRVFFQLVPSTLPIEEIEFGLLPTPRAMTIENKIERLTPTAHQQSTKFKQGGTCLQAKLLPTPRTSDFKGASKQTESKGRNVMTNSLMDAVENGIMPGSNGQLNPQFVAEMMGFPPDWTELPFLSGETKASKQGATQ